MKVYTSFKPVCEKPFFLTIGNFDGVHLGHQALLKALQENARKDQVLSSVITFSNHPSTVLQPNHRKPLILSKEHKINLLDKIGIDYVFMVEFTLPFSHQSAEEFLRKIHALCPFRRLILGQNAKLGNDRQGDSPLMHRLANELHYTLDFLPLESLTSEPISSSRIRAAIQNAEFLKAKALLGRRYSIVGKAIHGKEHTTKSGYSTLNFSLKGLCHPPPGIYAVNVLYSQQIYQAVAVLSLASHDRMDLIPQLEIYLMNRNLDLYDQTFEIIFEEFIRPERIFRTQEELNSQFSKDMEQAKHILNNYNNT